MQINLLAEMSLRYKTTAPLSSMPVITDTDTAVAYLRSIWNNDLIEYQEQAAVLFLTNSNQVIGWAVISIGGMTGTVMDPKVIYSHALLAGARNILLAHNHPSGNLKPSQADIDLTYKLTQAGNLLDIKVLDHIILTATSYFSMESHL